MSDATTEQATTKQAKPTNQVLSAVPVEVFAVEIEVADNSGLPVPNFVVAPSRKVKYYAFVTGDQLTVFDNLLPAKNFPQWASEGILKKVKEARTPDKTPEPEATPQQ